MMFSDIQKKQLIAAAREAILSHLEHRQPCYSAVDEVLRKKHAVFVTLHKDGVLRGCIGTISPSRPLVELVREMAQESAFNDPRFAPVTFQEFTFLDVEISVLSEFTHVVTPEEIIPGQHGLYLRHGGKSGLLLPQVAVEQGWDRETFLTHLCYKAGLLSDVWKGEDSELFIFTAVIVRETDLT